MTATFIVALLTTIILTTYIPQVDWDKALKVCASENGQLVRIESPQKDISLQGFLAGKSENKRHYLFIDSLNQNIQLCQFNDAVLHS